MRLCDKLIPTYNRSNHPIRRFDKVAWLSNENKREGVVLCGPPFIGYALTNAKSGHHVFIFEHAGITDETRVDYHLSDGLTRLLGEMGFDITETHLCPTIRAADTPTMWWNSEKNASSGQGTLTDVNDAAVSKDEDPNERSAIESRFAQMKGEGCALTRVNRAYAASSILGTPVLKPQLGSQLPSEDLPIRSGVNAPKFVEVSLTGNQTLTSQPENAPSRQEESGGVTPKTGSESTEHFETGRLPYGSFSATYQIGSNQVQRFDVPQLVLGEPIGDDAYRSVVKHHINAYEPKELLVWLGEACEAEIGRPHIVLAPQFMNHPHGTQFAIHKTLRKHGFKRASDAHIVPLLDAPIGSSGAIFNQNYVKAKNGHYEVLRYYRCKSLFIRAYVKRGAETDKHGIQPTVWNIELDKSDAVDTKVMELFTSWLVKEALSVKHLGPTVAEIAVSTDAIKRVKQEYPLE